MIDPIPSILQELENSSYLFSGNASYLEALFEQYLHDPTLLPLSWQTYFNQIIDRQNDVSHADIRAYFTQCMQHAHLSQPDVSSETDLQLKVHGLIDAYRKYGHYQADLDPLKLAPKRTILDLSLEAHHITSYDLSLPIHLLEGLVGLPVSSVQGLLDTLKMIYCGSIGFEYQHIADAKQRTWLQQRIESPKRTASAEIKRTILRELIQAEGLEKYLGRKFIAQKRFSLEGGDSLIPLIDELVNQASSQGIQELIIGMAHRGRLNVLINVLGKSPAELFDEFEGKLIQENRSGDVKYHKGFAADIKTRQGGILHIAMAFNPSHLEIVNPVVQGSVRSRQDRRHDTDKKQVLPVLIHGDAAFSGQGVVMETLELSQTAGYGTGGTLHIVLNNQIGFTTDPQDARSSWYCTDPIKMIDAPVFHVNGDDPEAVLHVLQLAFDFRQRFNRDVMIDLVCYRRHGHNEADEPAATQPLVYQAIRALPTVLKQYGNKLLSQNAITKEEWEQWEADYKSHLDKNERIARLLPADYKNPYRIDWTPYQNQDWRHPVVTTGVDPNQLRSLAHRVETLPPAFKLQDRVTKILHERQEMTADKLPLNWGYAEILAYASLLQDGYSVRLSGQDSARGTFFHRHAVLHDMTSNKTFVPLSQISEDASVSFTVIDSILSESAVMAFEYGYAISNPHTLVIWEAQYGDFVNGAQVVIDQFLSSSEQKWGRLCGLVLFLPHGYEGSGPEHTSARLERFLQLCAQENMQVCYPTTPAQVFHLLRRQMLRPYRKPLIVMTPKSLLRHKLAVSSLQDLSEGYFQVLVPEIDKERVKAARRVILCTGKVYYDLLERRRKQEKNNLAIIRIEQLYPFPDLELKDTLNFYKAAKDIVWCQEESKNQGAWYAIYARLLACLAKGQVLRYIGRPSSAAPAVGSPSIHKQEQEALITEALA